MCFRQRSILIYVGKCESPRNMMMMLAEIPTSFSERNKIIDLVNNNHVTLVLLTLKISEHHRMSMLYLYVYYCSPVLDSCEPGWAL